MLSTIAIVGVPNVGKSTLFNRLTNSNESIISHIAGTTRDRCYGFSDNDLGTLLLIDTGGLTDQQQTIQKQLNNQVWLAIEEADLILFVVDAQAAMSEYEKELSQQLRDSEKDIILIANKADNADVLSRCDTDYYRLGFKRIHTLSAKSKFGMEDLMVDLGPYYQQHEIDYDDNQLPCLSIIGRPNAGKSTLFNTLIKQDRVVVSEQPHTTTTSTTEKLTVRDSNGSHQFNIVDTAGIRRKSLVKTGLESLSIIQSLRNLQSSDVTIYLVDGTQEIAQQDIQLIDLCLRRGVSVVIAINKIDHMSEYQTRLIQMNIRDRCQGMAHVPIVFISAKAGRRIRTLEKTLIKIYQSRRYTSNTAYLTRLLNKATEHQPPPVTKGIRPRLQFAHPQAGRKLSIIIRGKKLQQLPNTYKRYLGEFFRKKLKLIGTNVIFIFKQDDNPYE